MFLLRRPIHVLILIFIFCLVHGECVLCPYKGCQCIISEVRCWKTPLTSMPTLRTGDKVESVTSVRLYDNQIQEIPKDSLPAGIKMFMIENNPTWHIDPAAFNGSASTLETIIIRSTKFTELPDALLMLEHLGTLILSNNPIQNWNFTILSHIGKTLRTLELHYVDLRPWPEGLKMFSKLESLDISGSSLTSIPDDTFTKMNGSLYEIISYNTNLSQIPKSMADLRLQKLLLDKNSLDYLENLPEVKEINLDHNLLSDADNVVQALQKSANCLELMSLYKNQLTSIPNLSKFSVLRTIDLVDNSIYYKSDVNRSTNSVRYLLPASVETLSLSENKITALENIFPENCSLKRFNLKANPIRFIASNVFDNVKGLMLLDLSETLLTSIPLVLFSLKDLKILSLTGIPALNCTCPEMRQLGHHFPTIPSVVGDCINNRQLSIRQFYSNLDLECRTTSASPWQQLTTQKWNTGTNLVGDFRSIIILLFLSMTVLYCT